MKPEPVRQPRTIGAALRQRRVRSLRLGLSDMAQRLGITKGFLCQIETSGRRPSAALLARIAAEYRISPAALRAGWSMVPADLELLVIQNEGTLMMLPSLLRVARCFGVHLWKRLIETAESIDAALLPSRDQSPRAEHFRLPLMDPLLRLSSAAFRLLL